MNGNETCHVSMFAAAGGDNWWVIQFCSSVIDSTGTGVSCTYQIQYVEQPPMLITWPNIKRDKPMTLIISTVGPVPIHKNRPPRSGLQ